MRLLTADYIYPVSAAPMRGAYLLIDDDGTVLDLLRDTIDVSVDIKPEYHHGLICPGFVNAHCHLELSFLKSKITEGRGLAAFIKELVPARRASEEEIFNAAKDADAEMIANGIVMVGDISNNDSSVEIKKASRIHYHSFIEIYDLNPDKAFESFDAGIKLWKKFKAEGLSASISPHASYSVSAKLLKLIGDFAYENDSLLSIHNQESSGENDMFINGTGGFVEELNKISGAYTNWKATGFRSLPSVFVHLPKCNKIEFVHNTYSTKDDVRWAHLYNLFVWWCICPNANMYIENRLPDLEMFKNEVAKICIGTDSYASNKSLSVLDELKCIQMQYNNIPTHELIQWATMNGADFFGLQKQFGSFEKGKRPGINVIANVNSETQALSDSSYVIPLI